MAKNTSRKQQDVPQEEQVSESYISIGLGLLVVVVVGILLYNYFTQKNSSQDKSKSNEISQEATTAAKPGNTYVVVAGDTLWSIAEKAYNDGYKWTEIAKANNLQNSDSLEAGQKLTIPEVPTVSSAPAVSAEASPIVQVTATPVTIPSTQPSETPNVSVAPPATQQLSAITGTSYTVVSGDTLWDIACRAYGDCYAWVKIAQANKLANPDLIHPGNEFTLPR
ncbi:hypothetical protein A3A59_03150 [Candidatus Gottesmanbacteria bacterium RIFCSPLOWO2_01_FULL_42_10]|nr:MAG: hypothetical protein A3A59_03150 [Candidatus Gottesmanbacteria bacterium RIFCSPLOWO2_01_FULL_42_10]